VTDHDDEHQAEHVLEDDGYDGAAELLVEDRTVPIEVTLRGQFEPITGSYRWYGRVAASDQVASLVQAGARAVRLRTPYAEIETTLSDVDPWGRPRVEGFGAPPFEVAVDLPPTD
jgi:uncharacterized protein DUF4873